MAQIALFATPEDDAALHRYMALFCVEEERDAACLGYQFYKLALTGGQLKALKLLDDHGLEDDVMIVMMTVAGMRWNLLDKEGKND